nr:ASPIC/UnbV domain-containing protein [Candidatus Cloacimonadota bacterium]
PIIGTRVEVTQDKLKQIREVEGGKGTTNQHSQTLYFGFPSEDDVDIQVRYLDGKIINLKNQGINRIIRNVYN